MLKLKKKAEAKAEKEKSGAPSKCSKNCGNFGSAKFHGLCSQCYSKTRTEAKQTWKRHWTLAIIKLRAMRRFAAGKRPVQEHRNRCWRCSRRIGITGIECRCGYVFCGKHRYANEHECKFDHRAAHRAKLAKENKEVKANKFEKIPGQEEDS